MTALRRGRGRLVVMAALLSGVLALSGCSSDSGDPSDDGKAGQGGGVEAEGQRSGAENADVSAAQISITPEDAADNVGVNSDVQVSVERGTLDEVTLMAPDTGAEITGELTEGAKSWAPAIQLERATRYQLTVQASDTEGRKAHETATFTTVSPENSFIGYFTPEEGTTVGVGMPISLNFDTAITNKAEVEEAVEVTASSGQDVVGHWFSDTRLDLRPETYWAANSEITVHLKWDGLEGAPGITGVQDRIFSFSVGRSQISTVDASGYQMHVVRDGQTIKTLPISAGSDENPTYNGQMVISEKFVETRMNGATVDFVDDEGKSEYDIKDVPHAMRLSTSGTFIHGNYWGAGSFGSYNASHGCVGLEDVKGADDETSDGAWFFENSLLGDVVIVVNSNDEVIAPDNGLNGWNMTWSDWMAGSALS